MERKIFIFFSSNKALAIPGFCSHRSLAISYWVPYRGALPEYAVHRGGESFYSYYLAFMTLGNRAGTLMAAHMKKYPLGRTVIVGFLFSSAA